MPGHQVSEARQQWFQLRKEEREIVKRARKARAQGNKEEADALRLEAKAKAQAAASAVKVAKPRRGGK